MAGQIFTPSRSTPRTVTQTGTGQGQGGAHIQSADPTAVWWVNIVFISTINGNIAPNRRVSRQAGHIERHAHARFLAAKMLFFNTCDGQQNTQESGAGQKGPRKNGSSMHICICHTPPALSGHDRRAQRPPQAVRARWPERHPQTGQFTWLHLNPPCTHETSSAHKPRLSNTRGTTIRRGKCIKNAPLPTSNHHTTPQHAKQRGKHTGLNRKKCSF